LLAALFTLFAPALLAAPLREGAPQLSLTMLGLFSRPGDARSGGFGAGLQLGYRLTDQLALTADGAQLVARGGSFTSVAAGLLAVIDATPVAPFLALSFVRFAPDSVTQTGLATRTTVGADWHFTQAFALGLEVRTLTPLDTGSGRALVSGTEIGLRMVFLPALLR
jgi:hypothetical protein